MLIGITGGTGTIGKILVAKLKEQGFNFSCFGKDIRDRDAVFNWIKDARPECIIHLAAIVPVKEVNEHPAIAYSVNIGGTINLIEALELNELKPWFFYASTSHVYKSTLEPITEEHRIEPINTYGFTKLLAENILSEYSGKKLMQLCIGRLFSFYHATQKPFFLYPAIKKRLETENLKEPFKLMGGNSIRDFLNAEEVCDIIISIIEKRPEGIFNVGSGKGIKIKDFVQSLTSEQLEFIIDESEPINYLVADISKLNLSVK